MGVIIEIPSALKEYVNNQDEVEVDGSSVVEALDSLCTQFPELKPNLFEEDGFKKPTLFGIMWFGGLAIWFLEKIN